MSNKIQLVFRLKKNKYLINLCFSIILSLLLEVQMLHHIGIADISGTVFLNPIFQVIICIIVLFFAGRGFLINFLRRIKHMSIGMDALVVLGSASAFFFSIFQ